MVNKLSFFYVGKSISLQGLETGRLGMDQPLTSTNIQVTTIGAGMVALASIFNPGRPPPPLTLCLRTILSTPSSSLFRNSDGVVLGTLTARVE